MAKIVWRRDRVAVLLAAALTAGAAGCGPGPRAAEEDGPAMSPAKMRAVVAADAIISQGERDVADGERMRARDPVIADRLIEEGGRVADRGRAMKARVATMQD